MVRLIAAPLSALTLLTFAPLGASAQRLLETEGIELRGSARVVEYGAGTCNVSEERETAASYEQKRAHHGRPVDIWQLDFSVYNGSGRALDHLIANYRVVAEHPPCTNWSWPEAGRYPGPVEWGDLAGFIQRSGGGSPTQPGETLTDTKYIFVFHEHQPRFDSWSVDYNFAAGEARRGDPGTDAPRAPASSTPPAAADARPGAPPRTLPASLTPAETCFGKEVGAACWMELANRSGCYVWNPSLGTGETVSWGGNCSGGFAQGRGTDSWRYDGEEETGEGSYASGMRNGNWVIRQGNGYVREGSYVDGRQDGRWVFRDPSRGREIMGAESWVEGEKIRIVVRWTYDSGFEVEGVPIVDGQRDDRRRLKCFYRSDGTPSDVLHGRSIRPLTFGLDPDEGLDDWIACRELLRELEPG